MAKPYQLTETDSILRVIDGANIPPDPANADYQAYEAWVAAGNTADPYVALTIALAAQALAQLNIVTGSTGQIIRCVAAGVSVPSAWSAYVAALRAIANGSDKTSTALPTQPAYVANT